ncbi:MAG: hypothetical protein MI922_21005 [Bacteroidales bacterium]|nr:hypothetical protein [Bacteroidales bacterium]
MNVNQPLNPEICGNILLIQESNQLYKQLQRQFDNNNAKVFYVSTLSAAFDFLEGDHEPIEAILIDYLMCPSINNPFLTYLRNLRNQSPLFVLCSVYSRIIEAEYKQRGVVQFIQPNMPINKLMNVINNGIKDYCGPIHQDVYY